MYTMNKDTTTTSPICVSIEQDTCSCYHQNANQSASLYIRSFPIKVMSHKADCLPIGMREDISQTAKPISNDSVSRGSTNGKSWRLHVCWVRWRKRVKGRPNRTDAFFKVEHKTVSRITIQVITVELFAAQEAQALIQFHCASICGFGLEDDLNRDQKEISISLKASLGGFCKSNPQ